MTEIDSHLTIEPLTREAFAPFGEVIEADPASMRPINGGTTERFDALATVEAHGEGASAVISIFRGQPRQFPYIVTMMERHPLGSQSFTPLSGHPFLVVVSPDRDGMPDVPRVFLAQPAQGVNYRPDVWHHPLMAIGAVSDFLVVDRAGPGKNLQEYFFDTPYLIGDPTP